MKPLKQLLLISTLLTLNLLRSYETLSQSTASHPKNSVVKITTTLTEGKELVNSRTLKTMFATIDKQEATIKAADLVIQSYKEQKSSYDSLIVNKNEQIKLYAENEKLYLNIVSQRDDRVINLQKQNRKLRRKLKFHKFLNVAILVIGAAAYGYFYYVK